MNNQAFSKIWIFIIFIIIFSGGIFAWQYLEILEKEAKLPKEITKEEIANWKIYRDDEFGFEIKYPSDYSIKWEKGEIIEFPGLYEYWIPVRRLSTVTFFYPDKVSEPLEKVKGVEVEINVYDNANNLSLDEWLDYLGNPPQALQGDMVSHRKPVFIAGVEGIEGIHETCCLGCTRGIFILKENKIYNLDLKGYLGCEFCCFGEEAVFDQMLSTFRLLE